MNCSHIRHAGRATLRGYWLSAIAAYATIQAVAAIVSLCVEVVVLFLPDSMPLHSLVHTSVTVVGLALSALLTAPLMLGFKRMLWCRSVGEELSPLAIFELFGSAKRLFKYLILVLVRGIIIYAPVTLGSAPLLVFNALNENGYSFTGDLVGPLSMVIMACAALLMLAGMAATLLLTFKFFLSDFVLLDDQNTAVIDNLRLSWAATSGKMGYLFVFLLSFIPWFLLGLTGFGNLYVQPYFISSSAIFARQALKGETQISDTAVYRPTAEA